MYGSMNKYSETIDKEKNKPRVIIIDITTYL